MVLETGLEDVALIQTGRMKEIAVIRSNVVCFSPKHHNNKGKRLQSIRIVHHVVLPIVFVWIILAFIAVALVDDGSMPSVPNTTVAALAQTAERKVPF